MWPWYQMCNIFNYIFDIGGLRISCIVPQDLNCGKSTLVQVMVCCRQTRSHYINKSIVIICCDGLSAHQGSASWFLDYTSVQLKYDITSYSSRIVLEVVLSMRMEYTYLNFMNNHLNRWFRLFQIILGLNIEKDESRCFLCDIFMYVSP